MVESQKASKWPWNRKWFFCKTFQRCLTRWLTWWENCEKASEKVQSSRLHFPAQTFKRVPCKCLSKQTLSQTCAFFISLSTPFIFHQFQFKLSFLFISFFLRPHLTAVQSHQRITVFWSGFSWITIKLIYRRRHKQSAHQAWYKKKKNTTGLKKKAEIVCVCTVCVCYPG